MKNNFEIININQTQNLVKLKLSMIEKDEDEKIRQYNIQLAQKEEDLKKEIE